MSIACENCGFTPPSLQCPACCKETPSWASFCPFCGEQVTDTRTLTGEESGFNASTRKLCPDGNCIGIIGEDGKCGICGKRDDDELRDSN